MLVQGKLRIYENYLNFASNFNSKTIFGFTDLRIPKWDIKQISTGKHLLSLKIIVSTTHGDLEFTSFLNNPLDLLIDTY